jgi:hypothetical protein
LAPPRSLRRMMLYHHQSEFQSYFDSSSIKQTGSCPNNSIRFKRSSHHQTFFSRV